MSRFFLFRKSDLQTTDSDLSSASSGGVTPGKGGKKAAKNYIGETDPMLPEKKRARRRLVGAITITLAAIITLPMIFDSEPQPLSQDILVDIPSRDKPSQTLSRESGIKRGEEKKTTAKTDKTTTGAVLSAAAEKKSDADSANDKKVQNKPAEKNPPKESVSQPVKTAEKNVEKAPAKKADAKSVNTKSDIKSDIKKKDDPIGQLITKHSATAKTDKSEKFVIQVAAVSTQKKANELKSKLQKAGINSYTQKVALKDGGERIRIRIGPLSGKKEVNNVCAKLNQLKLPCTLVN